MSLWHLIFCDAVNFILFTATAVFTAAILIIAMLNQASLKDDRSVVEVVFNR